jgi:8-oxo-dGTP diphosphatase
MLVTQQIPSPIANSRDDAVEFVPGIRVAVRAVIIRDDAVLLQKKIDDNGTVRYTFPGGAPNLGESLEQGLSRECLEEIGVDVRIVDLMHVADYYKPRDTAPPTRRQQVEILFRCSVPQGYEPKNGDHPDKHQVDVVCMPLSELPQTPLLPARYRELLSPLASRTPVYLGLID